MKTEEFKADIQCALECLKKGGIILYPTDTIWGIGCDATNSQAVKRIFQLKNRSDSKSMLTLVNDETALDKIIDDVPEAARELLKVAVDPITVIYDNAHGVADELIADDGSLGVRVTSEKFSNELCKRFGKPIVSTSANVSSQKAPAFFHEISDTIKNGVDYVVKYRQEDKSAKAPSHIIKISQGGVIRIIR